VGANCVRFPRLRMPSAGIEKTCKYNVLGDLRAPTRIAPKGQQIICGSGNLATKLNDLEHIERESNQKRCPNKREGRSKYDYGCRQSLCESSPGNFICEQPILHRRRSLLRRYCSRGILPSKSDRQVTFKKTVKFVGWLQTIDLL
jgi:hypothetical protein